MTYKIVALPEVRLYLSELIQILYKEEYFSFEDSAIEYVTDLIADIEKNLPLRVRKPAPDFFRKYGDNLFYSSFRKNRQTTWYVFFTIHYDEVMDKQTYLIRFISNNHVVAKYLLS